MLLMASRFGVYSLAHVFSSRPITYLMVRIAGHTGSSERGVPPTGKSLALVCQTEHPERPLWDTFKSHIMNFQLMKDFQELRPFRDRFTSFTWWETWKLLVHIFHVCCKHTLSLADLGAHYPQVGRPLLLKNYLPVDKPIHSRIFFNSAVTAGSRVQCSIGNIP